MERRYGYREGSAIGMGILRSCRYRVAWGMPDRPSVQSPASHC